MLCFVTEDGAEEKALVLEPGEHCLPFSCRLLPDLPSSFEGQHGCVRYVAKAVIQQTPSSSSSSASVSEGKTDVVVARRAFTMAPGLNLCFLPEASVSRLRITLSDLVLVVHGELKPVAVHCCSQLLSCAVLFRYSECPVLYFV